MKFSIFNKFGALNSPPVFESFSKGLLKHGQVVCDHDDSADVAVIWSVLWNGRMRPAMEVFNKFRAKNKPVVVLEIGCLARDNTWKVGINGVNKGNFDWAKNYYRPFPAMVNLLPDKSNGNDIVICTQNPLSEQWRNQPLTAKWIEDKIAEIRKHSDRLIQIRAHPRVPIQFNINMRGVQVHKPNPRSNDQTFVDSLNNVKFLINHNSNPGVIAALSGVSVNVHETSLAYEVSNSLAQIESPSVFDRQAWLRTLEQTEYSIDEMKNAEFIEHLLSYLSANYQL